MERSKAGAADGVRAAVMTQPGELEVQSFAMPDPEPGAVIRMVLSEAMTLAISGIVLGLPVAVAASQLIRGRLFHIGVFDPPSIGIAVIVLAISAALAAYLPALRASSVAPLAAIRAS